MIHIHTGRSFLLVVAITVNDYHEPTYALGLTEDGASRRLLRKLDRQVRGVS